MTPLRQRRIEDMQLLNFATTTQRSYIHYVADFAKRYQLHLAQERKLSPQSVNTFVSAVPFLYLVTLEMPWDKRDFPRARLEQKLPVVLAPDEVQLFLDQVTGVKHRAALLTCYGSGLRISEAVSLKLSDIDSHRMLHPRGTRQGWQGSLHPALAVPAGDSSRLLPHPAPRRTPGCFPPGDRTCTCLREPCKPSAAKPGNAAACANASPPTYSVTALPPIC